MAILHLLKLISLLMASFITVTIIISLTDYIHFLIKYIPLFVFAE